MAMMQYKNALFISPQNETSHFNLGALLVTSGKVNEGMHYYRTALDYHNRNIHELLNMLVVHSQRCGAVWHSLQIVVSPADDHTRY